MDAFPLGGMITLAVLLPNLLAVIFPPIPKTADMPLPADPRLRFLTIFERIGQMGSFVIPFFYPLNVTESAQFAALAVMLGALSIYYAGWVRYIVQGRAEELFYRSMLKIPIPMAALPVLYFIAASILLGSVWLLLAAITLGIGHLGVTWINAHTTQ